MHGEKSNDGFIETEINSFVNHFKAKSATKLAKIFNVNLNAKSGIRNLIMSMIDSYNMPIMKEFIESNGYVLKTIRLDKFGKLKESMSLPTFKYCEIVNESWESSCLRSLFLDKQYLFVVFKLVDKDYYLQDVVIWEMPLRILDIEVQNVWIFMKKCLMNGNVVKYVDDNGRWFSYFPSSIDNPYVHVRPHAINRNDTLPLPVPDKLTGVTKYPKHSFWLNRTYVLKIIKNEKSEL